MDGFTVAQGDCNDCDATINPNAYDYVNNVDDDCDGTLDNPPAGCDANLALSSSDPFDGARSLELCHFSPGTGSWGLVNARWVVPDGSLPPLNNVNFPLGHGLLDGFGPNTHAQGGQRLLALSTGTARRPTDPDYASVDGFDKMYTCNPPMGFPKEAPACPGVMFGTPHDGVALEVTLRVPSNATGFSFDWDFMTSEWPNFVCTSFNDFALALVQPVPTGQFDANVLFDTMGNTASVNADFIDACSCAGGPPCMAGARSYACGLGGSSLLGTGFGQDTNSTGDGAGTYWMRTTVPTLGGYTITVRFLVYDSGDGIFDSTVLFDNWQWIFTPVVSVSSTRIANPN